LKGFSVVLRKECLDNLRDRRTVLSSFGLAFLGPFFFVGLMVFILDRTIGQSEDPTTFAVVGAEHAPQLMAYLESKHTEIERLSDVDPRELVIDGTHDLILAINADYPDRYRTGAVNTVLLVHDSSKLSTTRRDYTNLQGMIARYSRTIGLLRMQVRGIDANLVTPISAQSLDVSSPAARALTLLSSLPYFLVLVIFMGAFYLAIDTTAGEREHGSLEPLLSQPIGRLPLVLGKIGAAAVFSGISLLIFLFSLYLAMPLAPFERIGMALDFGVLQVLQILVVCIPLILFASGLLNVVASYAKSYKEAQTYLTIVILIPTLPLIVAQLLGLKTTFATMLVPSLSQGILISEIIKGESSSALYVLLSFLTTLMAAAAMSLIAISLYKRERILG